MLPERNKSTHIVKDRLQLGVLRTWLTPVRIRKIENRWQLRIHWVQAIVVCGLFALLVWNGLALSAYLYYRYANNYDTISYRDTLLLPLRWDNFQQKQGNYLISKAEAEMEEKEYSKAFLHLRVGVDKAPANQKGRELLAQFYAVWSRTNLAEKTLLEGLTYHADDPTYLKNVFSFLLKQQMDDTTISIADKLIQQTPPENRALIHLLAYGKALALFHRGNYDAAEAVIKEYAMDKSRDGIMLGIKIRAERGRLDLAIQQLRQINQRYPEDEEVYNLLTKYLRDAHREIEIRQLALIRQMQFPQKPGPRIDALYSLDPMRDAAQLEDGLNEIFRDFSNDSDAMLALATFAAKTGNTLIARRLIEHTKETDSLSENIGLLCAESFITAHQYQQALDWMKELKSQNESSESRFVSTYAGLEAIAEFGLGHSDAADIAIDQYLKAKNQRAESLVAVSQKLIEVGAIPQARKVLVHATEEDPLNQSAITELIKIDLKNGFSDELTNYTRKLLDMRKPDPELLNQLYQTLGSDHFLFNPDREEVLLKLSSAIASYRANQS